MLTYLPHIQTSMMLLCYVIHEWILPSREKMPLEKRGKAQSVIGIMNALDTAERDLRKGLDIMGDFEYLQSCEKNGTPVTPFQWEEVSKRLTRHLIQFKPATRKTS